MEQSKAKNQRHNKTGANRVDLQNPTITVSNNPLITTILKLKGVPYNIQANADFLLKLREIELGTLESTVNFLDERYPVPQLILGDTFNRARIREVAWRLMQADAQELCDKLAQDADPFIFGQHITLVDLIVAERTKHTPFIDFIRTVADNNKGG